jgi:DNA-binding beta-propeller fold protein YncE
MLLGCATRPDGKTIAMVAAGAGEHTLYVLDSTTGKSRQTLSLGRAWNGVVWNHTGDRLYVSGGVSGRVHVFAADAAGVLKALDPLLVDEPDTRRDAPWLAGLAISPDDGSLFVAALATDAIYRITLPDGKVEAVCKVNSGARPYCLRISADGKSLYALLWGAASMATLDPVALTVRRTSPVGSHPNDLVESGGRLFVSCGNDDSVLVLDSKTAKIEEWIVTRLTPRAPAGSTPSALALAPDQQTLYVANADNNCVALVDISQHGRSRVRGIVPTGWYPTSVCATTDGKRLIIGSAKGLGTGPNPVSAYPASKTAAVGFPYIVTLLGGLVSTVEIPDAARLAEMSRQALDNSPYGDEVLARPRNAPRPGANPIPSRVGDASPIRHVLYIIKENRTYDQVLGDLKDRRGRPLGNGDPRLTLFGEEVTPNHHALARDFVVLDNLYCDGEVSVDGHHWSNGAYVPDFMSRTWPQQYSGKGSPPLNEALAATPNGRIWDVCERHGVDYRTYYYHTRKRMSAEWAAARAAGRRDYDHVDVFLDEFREYERAGNLPSFMVMALSEDHTKGTTPGAFTPRAAVASNDLALGKIVEAVSRSKYWRQFAIFVIEDDAQNGPDHVDAHRTVALAVSPYTRRSGVDSTFYTTASVLRTMELILGLPPMSQFDAAATPLYKAFRKGADLAPYTCLRARTDLEARNQPAAYGAMRSAAMDFSAPDQLTETDEDALNRIIWHSVKGGSAPYPGVRRRALWTGGSMHAPTGHASD